MSSTREREGAPAGVGRTGTRTGRAPIFSISPPSDGTFRLEIHGAPSELDPARARRLRSALPGLAGELKERSDERQPEATAGEEERRGDLVLSRPPVDAR